METGAAASGGNESAVLRNTHEAYLVAENERLSHGWYNAVREREILRLQGEYADLQRRYDCLQECNDRQFEMLQARASMPVGSVADLRERLADLTAEYNYVCNECGDLEATLAKVREAVE